LSGETKPDLGAHFGASVKLFGRAGATVFWQRLVEPNGFYDLPKPARKRARTEGTAA